MSTVATKPATSKTRTLRFRANTDPVSPIAGLLTITAGNGEAAYVVTEFPARYPGGREFHLAKTNGGEGYSVSCHPAGEQADTCECLGSSYSRGGPCRHRAAIRKLIDLGML